MASKEYLSTGEASNLLNISRSTVSRNFDKGILLGQKNPITGERLISQESLITFMKQYNLSIDPSAIGKKKILLGTPDDRFFSLYQKVLSGDSRVKLERVNFGSDVLVRCSKDHPDLLIIDEDLPDIPCAEVIKSLRRMEDQSNLKILCGAKTKNTKPCLEWGANEVLAKVSLEEENPAEKAYALLNLPEESLSKYQKFEHQRRWPRVSLDLPVKIGVYSVSSPLLRDPGEAIMENISHGGAFLSQIRFDKEKIPGKPFRFLLEIDRPPLKDFRSHCKVVRLQSNGSLTAGVQFTRLSKSSRKILEAVSSK